MASISMASMPHFLSSQHLQMLAGLATIIIVFFGVFAFSVLFPQTLKDANQSIRGYASFFYASFLKPHTGEGHAGQQGALESFYNSQANVYDTTRARLLRGREDMLGLVAAQLCYKAGQGVWHKEQPVWVDIGGGTGWNIEAMQAYVDVPHFFSAVYLVDLSPSLLQVAKDRFSRLGWSNVKIVLCDARSFSLEKRQADLVTMSYSLSMIPDYYSVIDSLTSLLDANGILGVVDFYVQSIVDTRGRNYIGGSLQRHVNWIGRSFWRSWFELDRVDLSAARRDYLEYRFGTLKSVDDRNYIFSSMCIPYYIFMGRHATSTTSGSDLIEQLDAACTESPYLSAHQHRSERSRAVEATRSKAWHSAIVNLSARLPLPSVFYQNTHNRIYYDESLEKHARFKNEFIYAFTWEDSRVDLRLLKIKSEDKVLCLTSAGDNALDYLQSVSPARLHCVDLNPSQNHLLELKVAAYQALPYADFWKIFGEGKHPRFRELLVQKLSPYLSSHALQFWFCHSKDFDSRHGLYGQGGSGHMLKVLRWLFRLSGLTATVNGLCEAKTLNEQREMWPTLRRVLLSRVVHWSVVGSKFLWKAAGVPPAQAAMISGDYLDQETMSPFNLHLMDSSGEAMWEYIENTLDPVAKQTLLSEDNFYYLVALQGRYTHRCHPPYLTARAHAKLSRPGAFDGLRIHTDEIQEVIARIAPRSLDHCIIMDSMDWFTPKSLEAFTQIAALNRVLKVGGKTMLRSAGLKPWYIPIFEASGFTARRVGTRLPGTCVDRVNMYASTWLLTKTVNIPVASTDAETMAVGLLRLPVSS